MVETQGTVIAALLITYEWSDWRNGQFWWIQSVYVRAAFRGAGVYRALHDAVVARARDHGGVCGIRLYVETDNTVAQRAYESVGMNELSYRIFEQELR